jgi:hypothetical protein
MTVQAQTPRETRAPRPEGVRLAGPSLCIVLHTVGDRDDVRRLRRQQPLGRPEIA